ncbi:Detected protein of unknown function [Hibiscus syriacus]|uniref:DUF4220 domain-containing protein n=1 Tax=Hibiscus syriacus TaxID=106335 RepID=A0A6A2ZP17_HIBSY|nr:Detected protein of unknown function [Hibiscus syriacus]
MLSSKAHHLQHNSRQEGLSVNKIVGLDSIQLDDTSITLLSGCNRGFSSREEGLAKRISSARGDWALTDSDHDYNNLLKYVTDVPYDESILLWHIATDLCYHTEKEPIGVRVTRLQLSKTLLDYMLYLLVFQPTMMSAVAGIVKIRFRDTCEEAKRFFKSRSLGPNKDKEACEQIMSANTDVGPKEVKGDRSKSVLFNASILAKELQTMVGEDKWKIMSRVWVELVSYAASHCGANTHAAEVSKGGQLVTFFWLLNVGK